MSTLAEIDLVNAVRAVTKSPQGRVVERIQSLWSGYGSIFRFETGREDCPSLVVKHVCPPNSRRHPRGWSSDIGHERKLRSYRVERAFYENFAGRCDERCRVPCAYFLEERQESWLFVLEDLDAAGFPERRQRLSDEEMGACLAWLAHFHATFLGDPGQELWEVGTYWHLATRPDELRVMKGTRLGAAAASLDERLNGARYMTLVHGDAKVANFCFSRARDKARPKAVSAVDFQYVGRGVGVKDLAYFLSSCLDERECQKRASHFVDVYFGHLRGALELRCPDVDRGALEKEWRDLYPVAWADFMRFLIGWAPEHYKIHGYSEEMTAVALADLKGDSRAGVEGEKPL